MRAEDRERVLEEVVSRVLQDNIQNAFKKKNTLDVVINDTIYHERRRLESEKLTKARKQELLYWKKNNKRLLNGSEEEQKKILKEIITSFAEEIIGKFDPRVYQMVTKFVPAAMNLGLNMLAPGIYCSQFPKWPKLADRVLIQGEVKLFQALDKIGTIILVPTHATHMDSLSAGFALYKLGLPPYTYGAGLNLFTNSLISFFMHNLGAYKVDRKKTANLYKEVLKEYTTVSLEFGYDNLFFPGGTRSRSGGIETRLKLGLLGTGIRAYINKIKQGQENPKIFVVPCTISYPFVLEAATFIDDFLKEVGKSRYIIEDDEFNQPTRIFKYFKALMRLGTNIYVTICPPLDLFGNSVDGQGISYDKRGRPIDIVRYLLVNGQMDYDAQRDSEYTRELGAELVKAYRRHNVAMYTHVVAFVVQRLLMKHNPEMDIYRLLRTGGKDDNLPLREVLESLDKILNQLVKLAGKQEILIAEEMKNANAERVLDKAIEYFQAYHTKPVMFRKGDRLYPNDHNLIFYYHNRLENYGLEAHV